MYRQSHLPLFFMGIILYVILYVISLSTFSTINLNNHHTKHDRDNESQKNTLAYFGDRKECPFPSVNPFDPTVMQYIYEYPTVDCTNNASKPSLVYLDRIEWLRVNKTKAKLLNIKYEYCQYTKLKMQEGSDYEIELYAWSRRFSDIIRLEDEEDFLYVRCYYNSHLVSRSFVSRFVKKAKIEERALVDHRRHLKLNKPLETLNILMVGLDGMSKQAFERSMPKTRNFIKNELHARELHKFNKVGQNTFPNIIPLLTGKHEEELLQQWSYDEHFDKINHLFIWDEFKQAGYRTAFMTDVVWLTAFHYAKKGWLKPPFDYFYRPIPAKLLWEKRGGHMGENCIGDIPEITMELDYWLQLTSILNKTAENTLNRPETPYFAYSFFTRLSHDFASLSCQGDELYLHFFQQLKERNTLNNTVMVVFSDHGGRFGKVRAMYQGMLESRMPFVFFIFPEWFQQKYPQIMATFTTNQKRLATMFDIHATLQDLMNFKGHAKNENFNSTRGISLLREIPFHRTCKDAGIPIKYCLCSRLQKYKISNTISTILVSTLYHHIVHLTKHYREKKCHHLKLKSIVSVLPMESESSEKSRSFFQTTIETFPGDAVFEATLSYDSENYKTKVEGDVVRLNMYKGQDQCMRDLTLKPFCYCRAPPTSRSPASLDH